jgi:hypothetical protein
MTTHTSTRHTRELAAASALAVTAAGAGALAHRARVRGLQAPDHGPAFDAWRTWRDEDGPLGILAAGVLAPSPHNTQPWCFALRNGTIEVSADPGRRLYSVDPYQRELRTALGCAVENLTLAAQARGYDPVVEFRGDNGWPGRAAARVRLVPAPTHAGDLYDMIGERHSNRGPFRTEPVPPELLARFRAVASDLAPATLLWVNAAEPRQRLGDLLVDAARAVVADGAQSRDGYDWFRHDPRAIDAHQDGLTLDVLGLSPAMTDLAKLLPTASRKAADAFWVHRTHDVHTRTAAAYGLILVPDPHDPVQQLTGGRLLERLHLLATAEELGFQHLNQITERIDRDAQLGRPSQFGPRLAEIVGRSTPGVLAMFRIGYPVRPGQRSPRRTVTKVLTQ